MSLLNKKYSSNTSSGISRCQYNFSSTLSTGERYPTLDWNIDSKSTKSWKGSFDSRYKSKSQSRLNENNYKRKSSHLQTDESLLSYDKR